MASRNTSGEVPTGLSEHTETSQISQEDASESNRDITSILAEVRGLKEGAESMISGLVRVEVELSRLIHFTEPSNTGSRLKEDAIRPQKSTSTHTRYWESSGVRLTGGKEGEPWERYIRKCAFGNCGSTEHFSSRCTNLKPGEVPQNIQQMCLTAKVCMRCLRDLSYRRHDDTCMGFYRSYFEDKWVNTDCLTCRSTLPNGRVVNINRRICQHALYRAKVRQKHGGSGDQMSLGCSGPEVAETGPLTPPTMEKGINLEQQTELLGIELMGVIGLRKIWLQANLRHLSTISHLEGSVEGVSQSGDRSTETEAAYLVPTREQRGEPEVGRTNWIDWIDQEDMTDGSAGQPGGGWN